MSLSARNIALQGFGAASLFIALQGLLSVDVPAPSAPPMLAGGGGGQISQSEWLRRYGPVQSQVVAEQLVSDLKDARDELRKKRRRNEDEILLILG